MKILHIVPALNSGGVETGTIDLAITLKKLGHTVVIVSSGGKLVEELAKNNILHIKLPVNKKSISSALLIPKVARILEYQSTDIVHASSRVPAWIGFFACKLSHTPFVTSCHGFYSKHFLSAVMGWGKLVMVISDTIKRRMIEDFKVPESKIRLVYRGVDLKKYSFYFTKHDKKKDVFTISNIARLTPIKGQYEFIKAMKLVIEKIPNIEVLIVGEEKRGSEDYLDKLKKLTKELGIESNVSFLGKREDIPELLAKSDCLVLSTNVPEGFGRTIIEAGASGTAVCASNIGGIREIVDHGISGLLFEPNNKDDMAQKIIEMLSNVSLREKCATNLRKKVEENFTLDEMVKNTLSVYEEAVKP
jgi:glycosyltransferase involved in cell wall biosynthesis